MIYTINLILCIVFGFTVANIIRQYKVKQALKENDKFIDENQPPELENPTAEDLMKANKNLGRTEGRLEIIKKFNYLIW